MIKYHASPMHSFLVNPNERETGAFKARTPLFTHVQKPNKIHVESSQVEVVARLSTILHCHRYIYNIYSFISVCCAEMAISMYGTNTF